MIPLTCKLKLKRLLLYIFKFYVAAKGFRERTPFYLAKTSHNTNPAIVSITPLLGPFVANVFASLMLERQTPPATYMLQAICQAWNQSRVNALGRSGPLHQDIAHVLNEYT